MKHYGDFDTSTVLYGKFSTFRPSTGAAFTLGGTPALSVYKDNSTTQSTTGVTLTADFDSVTGLNHFAIDMSADLTFYSAGSFFEVVVTTGTIDSVSVVGAVVGAFTIRKNSALKPTTAARTLDVTATGEGGIDWANVGAPTTSLNLSGTTISTSQVAASVTARVTANSDQLAGQTITAAAGVTFPASVASPTNITAGIITTVTNLTNAPTAGDLTATMKTSVTTAATAATPTAAAVTAPVTVGTNSDKTGYTLLPGTVPVKKNVAITITFPMTDATTHAPKTGLTVTAQRTIDGAAVASCANSVAEVSLGVYSLLLAAADVNGSMITVILSATGADTRFIGIVTQP